VCRSSRAALFPRDTLPGKCELEADGGSGEVVVGGVNNPFPPYASCTETSMLKREA
jgi:hypothetical protein